MKIFLVLFCVLGASAAEEADCFENRIFYIGSIMNNVTGVCTSSAAECQINCQKTPGCNFFTFFNFSSCRHCWLYSNITSKEGDPFYLSGPRSCSPGESGALHAVPRCVPMRLKMEGNIVAVPCEVDPDGRGAWTVFQRRGQFGNPERYFSDKTWAQYQDGFGNVSGEFWLGLDNVAKITARGTWQLRIDLNDWDGKNYSSIYKSFKIQQDPLYRLELSGFNANLSSSGDSLTHSVHDSNGMAFSTKDKDNDACSHTDCANTYAGAWWYNCCQKANLNGINYKKQQSNEDAKGIYWKYGGDRGYGYLTWKSVQMKTRKILD